LSKCAYLQIDGLKHYIEEEFIVDEEEFIDTDEDVDQVTYA